MISEHDFDAIERYLCNTMTGEEKDVFEKRMLDDPAFRMAVQEFGTLIKGVEMAVMKEKMNAFHQQIQDQQPPHPEYDNSHIHAVRHESLQPKEPTNQQPGNKTGGPKNKSFPDTIRLQGISLTQYMVAASFLLLLAISAWWFATQRPPHMKLYAAYFTPDPGLITPMSADADYVFYHAMVDYKLHDYDKAISKWESLLPYKPANDTLNYFIGVAELARGHAEDAIPLLQFVTTQQESVFLDDAYFYLGMAHLKLGNTQDAAESLEYTSNQRGISVLQALQKKRSI